MRGVNGNQYTKILIDNIPVKASVLSGVPIEAQLPVRQAERIEIIYLTLIENFTLQSQITDIQNYNLN